MAEPWRYEPDDDSLYWEHQRRRRKLRIMGLIAAVIVAAMILTLLPRTRRVRRAPTTTEPGVQVLEVRQSARVLESACNIALIDPSMPIAEQLVALS